jgi:hypothetical protein
MPTGALNATTTAATPFHHQSGPYVTRDNPVADPALGAQMSRSWRSGASCDKDVLAAVSVEL